MKPVNYAAAFRSHQQKMKEMMKAAALEAQRCRERTENLKTMKKKDAKES